MSISGYLWYNLRDKDTLASFKFQKCIFLTVPFMLLTMLVQRIIPMEDVLNFENMPPKKVYYFKGSLSFVMSSLALIDLTGMMKNKSLLSQILRIKYGPHTIVLATLNLYFEPIWILVYLLISCYKWGKQLNTDTEQEEVEDEPNLEQELISKEI